MEDEIRKGQGLAASAAKGALGGFFGCFGVLAAILLGGFILLVIGAVSHHEPRAITTSAATDTNWSLYCAGALPRARRQFIGAGSLDLAVGSDPWIISHDSPKVIACPGSNGDHSYVYAVAINCDDPLEASCVEIRSVLKDGKYLKAR